MNKAAVLALLVMTSAQADPTPATRMCRSSQATDTAIQILREQIMGIADRVSETVFRTNAAIRDVAAVDYNAVQSVAVCHANLYVKASGDLDHGTDVALQRMSATKPDLILLARTKRVGDGADAMFRVAINYSVQKSGGQTFVRVATPYGAEANFDMTLAMGYLLGVNGQAPTAAAQSVATAQPAAPAQQANPQEIADAEFEAADKKLNAAYKTAMAARGEAEKTVLRNAQRAWIKKRDTECAPDFDEHGNAAELYALYCRTDMAQQRATELTGGKP